MKIILFGSTGMLGNYVKNILNKNYEIISILRKDFDIEKDSWLKLENILNHYSKESVTIINCAEIIPQKNNSTDYKSYIKINSLFPHKLQEISNKLNFKFIHITTDCVFDGKKGNYSENDLHTSNDIYGISKSLGEPENSTIIRTSIIGEEIYGKKSLLEWVKSNKDKQINGFINHKWNGITCLTLAKFIKFIIDNNNFWKGVKHIYSENIVTKYDLCCYINEIYNLNIKVNKFQDTISKNMTLNGEIKIKEIIYEQILELKDFKFD